MSKELIERLRADAESTDDIGLCADAADRIEQLEADNKQMRRALEILREALSTATNSNIVDYIDAVVAFNEGDPQLYRGASAGMISWALRRPRRPT